MQVLLCIIKVQMNLCVDYHVTEGYSPKTAEELSINRRLDLEQSCERQILRRTSRNKKDEHIKERKMNITDSRGNSLSFLYYNAFDDVFLKRLCQSPYLQGRRAFHS